MTRLRRSLLLLVLGLVAGACRPEADEPTKNEAAELSPSGSQRVHAGVREALEKTERVSVIVSIADPDRSISEPLHARRARIRDRLDPVLRDFDDLPIRRRFDNLAAWSTSVDVDELERLARDPRIASVELDRPVHRDLYEAVPAIGAKRVQKIMGVTGAGVTVAVLDSGVDKTHPDLAGKVVAEHCFAQGNCPPNDTDEGTSAIDEAGHGTGVAGVVASTGTLAGSGFAPGADLVAVRVLDSHGQGTTTDWVAGLDWVLTNLPTQPVQVVNMSFGSSQLFDSVCDSAGSAVEDIVSQLNAQGVVVFASTGNDADPTKIELPACLTGVIAVGATYDSDVGREPDTGDYHDLFTELPPCFDAATGVDVVTCFTNSSANLDLLAPGAPMLTDAPGEALGLFWGTSEASPAAAGVAALMLEANPTLTPARIEEILKATGKQVVDPKNGLSFPKIDALAAVRVAECDGHADGDACDDGETCTATDACLAGVCTGSAPEPDQTSCDDGNKCSLSDKCMAGVCASSSTLQCPPTDDCLFVLGCSPNDGDCLAFDFNGGMACDDGDACTEDETCANGECNGGKDVACPEPDECHSPAMCDSTAGCPELPVAPDGTPCAAGVCAAGVCSAPPDDQGGGGSGGSAEQPPPQTDDGCSCATIPVRSFDARGFWILLGATALASRRKRR